jgi:hypothetical protein
MGVGDACAYIGSARKRNGGASHDGEQALMPEGDEIHGNDCVALSRLYRASIPPRYTWYSVTHERIGVLLHDVAG